MANYFNVIFQRMKKRFRGVKDKRKVQKIACEVFKDTLQLFFKDAKIQIVSYCPADAASSNGIIAFRDVYESEIMQKLNSENLVMFQMGLGIHELYHLFYTDFNRCFYLMDSVEKWQHQEFSNINNAPFSCKELYQNFCNIIEDAHIERRGAKNYPKFSFYIDYVNMVYRETAESMAQVDAKGSKFATFFHFVLYFAVHGKKLNFEGVSEEMTNLCLSSRRDIMDCVYENDSYMRCYKSIALFDKLLPSLMEQNNEDCSRRSAKAANSMMQNRTESASRGTPNPPENVQSEGLQKSPKKSSQSSSDKNTEETEDAESNQEKQAEKSEKSENHSESSPSESNSSDDKSDEDMSDEDMFDDDELDEDYSDDDCDSDEESSSESSYESPSDDESSSESSYESPSDDESSEGKGETAESDTNDAADTSRSESDDTEKSDASSESSDDSDEGSDDESDFDESDYQEETENAEEDGSSSSSDESDADEYDESDYDESEYQDEHNSESGESGGNGASLNGHDDIGGSDMIDIFMQQIAQALENDELSCETEAGEHQKLTNAIYDMDCENSSELGNIIPRKYEKPWKKNLRNKEAHLAPSVRSMVDDYVKRIVRQVENEVKTRTEGGVKQYQLSGTFASYRVMDYKTKCGINRYKLFDQTTQGDEGLDICVQLLIDESGSMESNRENAVVIAAIIHDICVKLGIPVRVASFSLRSYLYCDFDAPMPQLFETYLCNYEPDDGTDEASSLLCFEKSLLARPESYKYLFLVTDGAPGFRCMDGTKPQEWLNKYQMTMLKKGVQMVACCTGSCAERVSKIYSGPKIIFNDYQKLARRLTDEFLRPIKTY